MPNDWIQWHEEYALDTNRRRRLRVVRHYLHEALDTLASRPIRLLSLCAGDGRDVLGVLGRRQDAARVTGRLVELDRTLAERAREAARTAGLSGIEVVVADAGHTVP